MKKTGKQAKRVLMVAYHFPPLAGSSGIQRTLRFVQQLPGQGWEPVVLTISPKAYERVNTDLLADVPANVRVHRAWGLDTARQLSLAGRYPAALARPDRWMSWRFAAVRDGLRLIRELEIDAIWTTYPIATAHRIGAELQRRSGLPWIADFRDPMAQHDYPADPVTRAQYLDIERRAADAAAACVFTTPSALRTYQGRYPQSPTRWRLIENGYDEGSFADAEAGAQRQPLNPGRLTLLHSGLVYPSERDPTQLFEALGVLKSRSPQLADQLRVRFRAAVHEKLLHGLAEQFQVSDMVEIVPPTAYRAALAEMLDADGLLILQASNCNEQIPAKLYEALRSRRPILCLSDPRGDTIGLMRRSGIDRHAPLDDAAAIVDLLQNFMAAPQAFPLANPVAVSNASRQHKSAELAQLLDEVCMPT